MIRPVRASDAEAWGVLRAGLWPDAPAPDLACETRAFFAAPLPAITAAWIATAEGDAEPPIGFIEISVRAFSDGCDSMPVPHVEGWYVERFARGRGFGGALMRAAEAWARAAGFVEIASDTEIDNAASLRAHEACGFSEVDRLIKLRKVLA
jgi:aminoglycoside 6'-N-acetyltransferase I